MIDDNAVNRQVLGRMVQRWGMQLTEAASGQSALNILNESASQGFDLLLLDFDMPGMDGFELTTRLKKDPLLQDLKIILLSSTASPGQGAKCRELGIDAYLTKPVAHHELALAIRTLFARSALPKIQNHGKSLVTRHTLHEGSIALNILVAEDNLVNQKLIFALLKKWGHHGSLAQNGQEALDQHTQGKFDLILMDMQMPIMDGLEATKLIRVREANNTFTARTPIYALTAAALTEEQEAGLQAGLDGYLTKPINTKKLQELLSQFGHIHTQ